MGRADDWEWEVRVEECTVVLELPRELALDARSSERLHERLSAAVARPGVDRVLTLVDVEHPLTATLHDVVCKTARTAADHEVAAWHVVAEHDTKAVALEQEIPALETAVFEDERAARQQDT